MSFNHREMCITNPIFKTQIQIRSAVYVCFLYAIKYFNWIYTQQFYMFKFFSIWEDSVLGYCVSLQETSLRQEVTTSNSFKKSLKLTRFTSSLRPFLESKQKEPTNPTTATLQKQKNKKQPESWESCSDRRKPRCNAGPRWDKLPKRSRNQAVFLSDV